MSVLIERAEIVHDGKVIAHAENLYMDAPKKYPEYGIEIRGTITIRERFIINGKREINDGFKDD